MITYKEWQANKDSYVPNKITEEELRNLFEDKRHIKRLVNNLNKIFKKEGEKLITAHFPISVGQQRFWHLCCTDSSLYWSKKYRTISEGLIDITKKKIKSKGIISNCFTYNPNKCIYKAINIQ